jgi:hypothetical protein
MDWAWAEATSVEPLIITNVGVGFGAQVDL